MAGDGLTSTAMIKVDRAVVDDALDFLVDLRVAHAVGTTSHLRLRFDVTNDDHDAYAVGKSIEVLLVSPEGGSTSIFAGDIVSVGIDIEMGRRALMVDAYDKSYKLASHMVVKSNVNQSFKDIFSVIAGQIDLSPDISSSAALRRQPADSTIQQYGTALRFLSDFCRQAGCEWLVQGDKLTVRDRASVGSATTVEYGVDLISFTARFSSMEQAEEVQVRGWDSLAKETIVGKANGKNTAAPSATAIVKERERPPVVTTWPRALMSKVDADSAAEGIATELGSTALHARGVTVGNPEIVKGKLLTVEGVSEAWNGNYYITEVEHVFGDDQNFITRFTAGSVEPTSLVDVLGSNDESNTARFANGLTIGIVTNNDDPDLLNRVKVKFPYLSDDEESDWARLVLPGAGNERGLLMLPEIDDEVLVGFEHGDIRRPFVLGGLWNGKDKPPPEATGANLLDSGKVTSRSLTTRLGHSLTLADKGPDGDYVELALADQKAQLWLGDEQIDLVHTGDFPITVKTSAASLEIAKGGDITMKGKKITIEATDDLILKGMNIKATSQANTEISASANFTAKGTGGAKLESTAMAEVKGSMVKIN